MSASETRQPQRIAPESGVIPDAVLQLTALLVLLRPLEVWWATAPVVATAVACLAVRRWRRHAAPWLMLSAAIGAAIVATWPAADNHIYLLAYWCLAIGLAQTSRSAAVTLRESARWLVAGAFVFAVLWKGVLSADYLDGRFFRVTLLTDDRLSGLARLAGGLSGDDLEAVRAHLRPLPEGAELLDDDWTGEPPRLRALALGLTWGGLALEAGIALLFLLPASGRGTVARHGLLVLFCLTTYAVAPVAGFGCLLAVMGLAQCVRRDRAIRGAYVVAYALVVVYSEVPWALLLL
jgi:hypothetical protein